MVRTCREYGIETAVCNFEIRYSDTGNTTPTLEHAVSRRHKNLAFFAIFDYVVFFFRLSKCRTTTAVLTVEAMTVGEAVVAMEATAMATTAMAVGTATVAEIAMAVKAALVDTANKSKFKITNLSF